eukprot:754308-Hanusia_phi.AAC.6
MGRIFRGKRVQKGGGRVIAAWKETDEGKEGFASGKILEQQVAGGRREGRSRWRQKSGKVREQGEGGGGGGGWGRAWNKAQLQHG